MKTKIIFIVCVVLFGAFSCGLQAKGSNKDRVSETRRAKNFSSIRLESVGDVHFTQAENYSLRLEGLAEFVGKTETEVKGQTLVIGFKEKVRNGKKVDIYISAPNLTDVVFTGVGSFTNDTPLKLDDVTFKMQGVGGLDVTDLTCKNLRVALEGVGEVNVNVHCDHLKLNAEGVGSVKLTGTAVTTDINKSGIGGVNLRDLKVGK